jgi:hypothetical protein
MSKHSIILGTLFFFLFSFASAEQEDALGKYVYMIRNPATRTHKTILQTGFRMRGRKGVITSLHGVADGVTFSAYNESGDVLNGLKIVSVDVDHDLALLRSAELENRSADGLEAVENLAITPGESLRAFGHPEGINLYIKDDLRAGTPVLKKLHSIIPPDSAPLLGRRKSPSLNITILNISSGNVGPGYSGAPVVNSDGQVVGILDGGLRGGALAISWAIPINAAEWQDISSAQTTVKELVNVTDNNLFVFTGEQNDDAGPEPIQQQATPYTYQIYGWIESGHRGNRVLINRMTHHEDRFPFSGRLLGFDLTITQFTNGKPCGQGQIQHPPNTDYGWGFPKGSTSSGSGEARPKFAFGVQQAFNSQFLELLINPGLNCFQ